MSRGGRGGFGGRGGRGKGPPGLDVPFDTDLHIDSAPSPLFPQRDIHPPNPPSKLEKLQISNYRSWRAKIHEGPFYTVLGENFRVQKSRSAKPATFDPFEGMPTYTVRYKKKRRTLPRLSARNYVMEFFPEELLSTLDPKYHLSDQNGNQNGISNHTAKTKKEKNPLFFGEDEDEASPEDEQEDEQGDNEEMVENDFEEDEDDMADDYNAEQYFDGGEDAGDDFDGGGGGGDDEATY
ncbi:MAG: hypothetical protein M1834_004569 [Cirrosporium novae-zelandiae]|nr:MAG: hypothetical protein M1834_004569 [Cirrosporium novae-zelandiae]